MKQATFQMVGLALDADDTLSAADRQLILAVCRDPALATTRVEQPSTATRWLTPPQAAEALSVNPRTVQRRIRDGSLPSTLIGGCRRIPSSALERLIPHPWQPAGTDPCASRNPTVPGDCRHGTGMRMAE